MPADTLSLLPIHWGVSILTIKELRFSWLTSLNNMLLCKSSGIICNCFFASMFKTVHYVCCEVIIASQAFPRRIRNPSKSQTSNSSSGTTTKKKKTHNPDQHTQRAKQKYCAASYLLQCILKNHLLLITVLVLKVSHPLEKHGKKSCIWYI